MSGEGKDDSERIALEVRLRAENEMAAAFEGQKNDKYKDVRLKDSIKVGGMVSFGNYPQSSGEPEPIIWRVLAVEKDRALLLSEKLLDANRFDPKTNLWKFSELCKWLNGDFLNKAFSLNQQRRLLTMSEGKVTCLSVDEVKTFLLAPGIDLNGLQVTEKPTAFAKKNGAYVDPDSGSGWWWLRSRGRSGAYAAYVNYNGHISEEGGFVYNSRGSVRPAVWLMFGK